LKSPTAIPAGPDPTAKVACVWKLPDPVPSRTLTVLSPEFAVTISRWPSLLRSPTATLNGPDPTEKVACAWKLPDPVHMQEPDEQLDPDGHYRDAGINHISYKNNDTTANLKA
jgi:hypothetical protein